MLANLWDSGRRLADWRGLTELVRELERGDDEVFTVVRRLSELVQGGCRCRDRCWRPGTP